MEINTGGIKNNADAYLEHIDNITKERDKIMEAVDDLRNGWKGERASYFCNAVEDTYIPELDTAIASLKNYYDFISKVPGAYQTLDDSYASKNIEV